MKEYIKLLRVKHYIKNLLILVPMFFAGMIFDENKMKEGILGLICFCMISSAVYILNDLKDVDKDRKHPTKKNRPLASGRINIKTAIVIMILCIGIACVISFCLGNFRAFLLLGLYFALNIAYSMG